MPNQCCAHGSRIALNLLHRSGRVQQTQRRGSQLHQGPEVHVALASPEPRTEGPASAQEVADGEPARVNTAYPLRESFGQLWSYGREGWARRFFENWRASLKWQRLEPYEKFAKMIDRHWDGITAYYKPENKSLSDSWKDSIIRFASSSAGHTDCVTKNTCGSKSSLACCQSSKISPNQPHSYTMTQRNGYSGLCLTAAGTA